MTRPKGGLGRGLAALIPTGPQTSVVNDVFMGGPTTRVDVAAPATPEALNGPGAEASAAADDAEQTYSSARSGVHPELTGANHLPAINGSHPPDSSTTQIHDIARRPPTMHSQSGPRYEEIAIDNIRPNPRNPRTVFDEDALAELAHSLREFGLLQPVVVRPVGEGYELVMGERRWRAAERAGLSTIPAIVRRTEDADLLRDALLENIHRANLNPLEEAAAYQQLLQEFDVTQDELAQRIGRSRPVISNTIRLLRLPVPVQRRVAAGILSAGHARALLSIEDPERQEELATRVVAEGLSVRGTEEAVVLMSGRMAKGKRTIAGKVVMPHLTALAGTLSDAFDTRVRVEMGRQKGRVIVEFATADDLERIVGIMAPGAMEDRRTGSARNEQA